MARRKERRGRPGVPQHYRMKEIRRRSRVGPPATDRLAAAGEFVEEIHADRARKNTNAINLTKARNAGLHIPRRSKRASSLPPGRNMQAEKPPSPTGLVHPAPQGGEDRRPHKPRRN